MSKPSIIIIEDTLNNKTVKAKQKVVKIGEFLMDGQTGIDQLITSAKKQNDTNKATIIESIEYASKTKPDIVNEKAFAFVTDSLRSNAARVKWESAKVIANTAHLFPTMLNKAVGNLLSNAEHAGTVVRWSAAGALSKIIQCMTKLNKTLIPAIEALEKTEQDKTVKKIYQQALKKAAKQAVE